MFPDSKIAQAMTIKRTKASYVMQHGVAREEKLAVVETCRKQKFSLIIDESTDISVSQILAIAVRFYDEEKQKVLDVLLDAVEVEDGTGEGLYIAVTNLLRSFGIPLQNIVGFASDNCSTMMGVNSGFQAFLKRDIPSVFILGCICHSFALCASHACRNLPSYLESFLKNVCSYFARSSKRQHLFRLIQDVVHAPKHKILKLCQTRWLSRGNVIARVLEQWEALTLFFQSEAPSDKVDGAGEIYQTFVNAGTKHMLLFLNYVLSKVDSMNTEFQSEQFRLHKVHSVISDEYRSILGMFITSNTMSTQSLSAIDPADERLHKDLKSIDLGGRCESMLLKQSLGDETRFRSDARSFLVDLCVQIRMRFPLAEDSILSLLKVLDPHEAMSQGNRTQSIIKLASYFPTLVAEQQMDDLQDQWRALPSFRSSLEHATNLPPCSFWHEIRSIKDGLGRMKFCLLSKFMSDLLVLPHSSACVERIFSQVNIVKNEHTNCLKAETVVNRLLAKQALSRQNAKCHTWHPSKSLINDVQHGQCHARYIDSERKRKEQNGIVVHDVDEIDCVQTMRFD